MEKFYHYSINKEVLGPFTLAELKEKRLYEDTMFSFEGSDGWVPASTVQELKEITIVRPPELPVEEDEDFPPETPEIYDNTYEKETEATTFGVLLLILKVCLLFLFKYNPVVSESSEIRSITYVMGALLTIIIVSRVAKIAKRQNRDSIPWGIFALFLPALALIIIGQLKKLNTIIDVDSLSEVELLVKTNDCERHANSRNYKECYSVTSQLIKSEFALPKTYRLHGISSYFVGDYASALKAFEIIKEDEDHGRIANLMLGNVHLALKDMDKARQYWLIASNLGELRAQENLDKFFPNKKQGAKEA